MGYTHYWYRPKEIPQAQFEKIEEDFKKFLPLFKAMDIQLADGNGKGEPELTKDLICFNGKHNCGHTENKSIVIPWPSKNHKNGVAPDSKKAVNGSWFAGVTLNQRTCNGTCDYETFYFPRILPKRDYPYSTNGKNKKLLFDCTKTAFRPYDLAVNIFLIIAKHYLKTQIVVHSDGEISEWLDAVTIVKNALGYGEDFILNND